VRSADPARAYTVVYDGDCRVCSRLVAGLKKWDRREELEILPLQTPGLAARFPWIPDRAFADSMQVVRASDGRTWAGAAAVEKLLDVLPRGRWIAWIFRVPFVRRLADRFYRWFARNRYQLGCGEHCPAHPRQGSE
jgi:predicted DCC family thiol-disulfide oxidoreductase YuxK